MLVERLENERRQCHGPVAGLGLGCGQDPPEAGHLVRLTDLRNGVVERIDVPALQAEQFAGPQAGEAAEQDETAPPGFDGVGQPQYGRRVEHRPHFGVLNARTPDGARIAPDQPVAHSGVHDRPQQPVRLGRLVPRATP